MSESKEESDLVLLSSTRRALLHRLAKAQAEARVPSVIGAVVREGQIVWTGARGSVAGELPTGDTQYRIGSITKTFVAVLVMRLRDEGLLDLGDALGNHLDTSEAADATIAQLLCHSSGLASEARGPWWERTPGELRPGPEDIFGEHPQPHPAGRRHHYSNPGYALLGALVERLRGAAWGDVLREEILEPLGMRRTTLLPEAPNAEGWAVHPWADLVQPEPTVDTGRMAPAGQLWSTAEDLCRFSAFLGAGDERVLAADSLAEMRVPAVASESADRDSSYGLGMQLLRRGDCSLAGHTGSMPGFLATIWTHSEERLAAVVLANATSGLAVGTLAADLLGIVAEREPRLEEAWRPRSEADPELLAITGPWYWGPEAYVVRLREGRLLELSSLAARKGRGSRFRPETDTTWTGLDGYHAGETLRIVRRGDGSVSHLDLGTFVFTRAPYDPEAPVPGGVDPKGWRGA